MKIEHHTTDLPLEDYIIPSPEMYCPKQIPDHNTVLVIPKHNVLYVNDWSGKDEDDLRTFKSPQQLMQIIKDTLG